MITIPSFLNEADGYTTASISHLRDLATQQAESIKREIEDLSFINTTLSLLDSSNKKNIHYGMKQDMLVSIPQKVATISRLQSFVAYINEAIKAKESICEQVRHITTVEYANEKGITLPEHPIKKDAYTKEDYLQSLPIKELNKYYQMQTYAATIGTFIHKDSGFDKAKKELEISISNPVKATDNGRDTLIYEYVPSINKQDVDSVFYKLQSAHREYQAQYNGILAIMDKTIKDENEKITFEYVTAMEQFKTQMEIITQQVDVFKTDLLKKMESLKIVLPDAHKELVKELESLSK